MGSEKQIPNKLYKYRPVNMHTSSIILKQELHVSGRKEFNDPFDCRIDELSYNCEKDEFQKIYNDKNHPLKLQRFRQPHESDEEAIKRLYEQKDLFIFAEESKNKFFEFVDQTGILCFSELPDQILMWSHYADKHQGICLGFDTEVGKDLFQIKYAGKYNTLAVKYCNEVPVFEVFNPDYSEIAEQAIFRKALGWEYEKEWRNLWKKAYTYKAYPPGTLTGVILGERISKEDEDRVRAWCALVNPQPKTYKAKLKKDTYGLEIPGLLNPTNN